MKKLQLRNKIPNHESQRQQMAKTLDRHNSCYVAGGRQQQQQSVMGNKLKEELKTEAKGPCLSLLLDILSSHYIVPTPTWIALKIPYNGATKTPK